MTFLEFCTRDTLFEMALSVSCAEIFDLMHSPSFLASASSSGVAVVEASENSKHGSGGGCKYFTKNSGMFALICS